MKTIQKYFEVIKRILLLLDTIEEAMYHIHKQILELRYEEAFAILIDIVEGIASIENAIRVIDRRLHESAIDVLTIVVKNSMSKVIDSYEQGKEMSLEHQITQDILPAFFSWKEEIEKRLKPYVIS